MVEKKAVPVSKKATMGKASSAVAATPRTIKKSAATTTKKAVTEATVAKKTVAKKTVSAATDTKKVKAPAVRKTAVPKAAEPVAAKPVAEKKAPSRRAVAAKSSTRVVQLTPEERHHMVQTAAYFIAERNGFSGSPHRHWADAELEIATKLGI